MAPTLYTPPPKVLISKRTFKVLLVLIVLGSAGAFLARQQPGWFANAASSILGWFGHETIAVDVATSPTRADILLDGERMTELPLRVRKDAALHRVSAVAPGYDPAEVTFKADADKRLILTLRPAKPQR
jgi:hypothetical protein